MANPQKDNGFTPIANEVLDKLISFPFPNKTGIPLSLCLFVIRKTWGYQKKQDNISLTQFEKGLNSNRPTVVHWLEYLVKANILVKVSKLCKEGYIYSFNKNYDQWKWGVKASELVKARIFASKGALTATSKGALTHKRKKESNKRNLVAKSDTTVFSLKKEIQLLHESPRRDLNVIGMFFEQKAPVFESKEQYVVAFKRHLKPANELKVFSDNQISDALKYAQKEYKGIWTIETLVKILSK